MPSGGKREGAGRKSDPNKKVRYTTRLRPDQIAWLQAQKNAAKYIEDAIYEKIEREVLPIII